MGIEKRKDDCCQKVSKMRMLTLKPKQKLSTKKGNAHIFLYKKTVFTNYGCCQPALHPTQTFCCPKLL